MQSVCFWTRVKNRCGVGDCLCCRDWSRSRRSRERPTCTCTPDDVRVVGRQGHRGPERPLQHWTEAGASHSQDAVSSGQHANIGCTADSVTYAADYVTAEGSQTSGRRRQSSQTRLLHYPSGGGMVGPGPGGPGMVKWSDLTAAMPSTG